MKRIVKQHLIYTLAALLICSNVYSGGGQSKGIVKKVDNVLATIGLSRKKAICIGGGFLVAGIVLNEINKKHHNQIVVEDEEALNEANRNREELEAEHDSLKIKYTTLEEEYNTRIARIEDLIRRYDRLGKTKYKLDVDKSALEEELKNTHLSNQKERSILQKKLEQATQENIVALFQEGCNENIDNLYALDYRVEYLVDKSEKYRDYRAKKKTLETFIEWELELVQQA